VLQRTVQYPSRFEPLEALVAPGQLAEPVLPDDRRRWPRVSRADSFFDGFPVLAVAAEGDIRWDSYLPDGHRRPPRIARGESFFDPLLAIAAPVVPSFDPILPEQRPVRKRITSAESFFDVPSALAAPIADFESVLPPPRAIRKRAGRGPSFFENLPALAPPALGDIRWDAYLPDGRRRPTRRSRAEDLFLGLDFQPITAIPPLTLPIARVRVMGASQTLRQKQAGLHTWGNKILLPEGSLLLAKNAVIDRDEIISCRRGLGRHGGTGSMTVTAKAFFEYLGELVVLDGTTLKYDALGIGQAASLTTWSGSYSPPAGVRMRGFEVDKKLIFTTNLGPFIQESATGTPRRTGMPRGLDVQLALSGTGDGWFAPDTQVSYRVIWGKARLAPGAPTNQEPLSNPGFAVTLAKSGTTVTVTHTAHGYSTGNIVAIYGLSDTTYVEADHTITVTGANTYTYTVDVEPIPATATGRAGKRFDVLLTTTIPQGVVAGDWFQVYRSPQSAGINASPEDEHKKLKEIVITAADIANGFVTFTDTFDDAFRGLDLYTNPATGDGIEFQNDRPPHAEFIVHFRGHTIYLNIFREHQVSSQLLILAGITPEVDTVTVTIGGSTITYIASLTEDLAARRFKVFTGTVDSENVRNTAKSLIKVINRDAGSSIYAYYASGLDDEPGHILFERRDLTDSAFTVSGTTVIQAAFTPILPLTSSNDAGHHKAAISRHQISEAAPRANEVEVAKLGFDILGAVTLRDSVIVATEKGIHEITGETDGHLGNDFIVREVDPTLILIHPECFVAQDNAAFGWFQQGIVRVTSAGSQLVSYSIKGDLDKITRSSAFQPATFFVPYESYQKLVVWVPAVSTEDFARLGYAYDLISQTWSGPWEKPVSCGVVLEGKDKMFLGHPLDNKVLIERKDYTDNDFYDEEIPVVYSNIGTTTVNGVTVTTCDITYNYSQMAFDEGFLVIQTGDHGPLRATVLSFTDLGGGTFRCVLDKEIPLTFGSGRVGLPIEMLIHWVDDAARNPALLKDFIQGQIYMESNTAYHHYMGFMSDAIGQEEWLPRIDIPNTGGWGSDWGAVWGDPEPNLSIPISSEVPRDHRRCRTLRPMYRHKWALEPVNIVQMALEVYPLGSTTTRNPT